MGFSRQEYWSGLPFLSAGDLPDPGIEPASPALRADSLPSEPLGIVNVNTTHCTLYNGWNGKSVIYIFYDSQNFLKDEKKSKSSTPSFRHDQFIQKIQISVWQRISRGRVWDNHFIQRQLTFSRANWPWGRIGRQENKTLKNNLGCVGDKHKYLQRKPTNQAAYTTEAWETLMLIEILYSV